MRAYGTVDELNSSIGVASPWASPSGSRRSSGDPERALRPGLRPGWPEDDERARCDPDRGDPRTSRARSTHRRVQRGRRTVDELPVARRAHRVRPSSTSRGPCAGGPSARPSRWSRDEPIGRAGPALPQPAVGRAVRDGPLREPRARAWPSRSGSPGAARPRSRSRHGELGPAELRSRPANRTLAALRLGLERRAERECGRRRARPGAVARGGRVPRRSSARGRAATHHRTRWAVASCSNHAPSAAGPATWAVVVGERPQGLEIDDHTLMLMRNRSSSVGRIELASPASVWSRQTNPGSASASALIGASCARKPSMAGDSTGAKVRPTFSWARCHVCSVTSRTPSARRRPPSLPGA